MSGTRFDTRSPRLARTLTRWGLRWRALAALFALLYVTSVGGTRAGTYHFPLVAFSQLLGFGVLAAWLAYSLTKGRSLPKTPLDAPILAFYLVSVLATAFSAEPRISVENLAYLTLLILAYYVLVDLLSSGWHMSDFVAPMVIVATVIIIAELLELAVWLGIWVRASGQFSPLLALGDYRRRLVMGPANVLAWYLVLVVPLILARLVASRSHKGRAQLGLLALLAGIVLGSTLSRSGLIGMAVGIVAFASLVLIPRASSTSSGVSAKIRRPRVIGSVLAVAAVSAALIGLSVHLLSGRLYSVSIRFELWRAAADMISARPLLGGGLGTFGYLLHQVPDPNPYGPDMYYNSAHNGLINVAAESGLLGLAAGLWLIAGLGSAACRYLWGPGRHDDGRALIIAGCVAGTLGLMASMLFDVPWVFPLTSIYVVLFAALIVSPLSSQRTAGWRPLRWASASLSVVAMVLLIWSDVGHALQQRAADWMYQSNPAAAAAALRQSVRWDPALSIYGFQLGTVDARLALENADSKLLSEAIDAYEREIGHGGDTAINNANLAWLEWQAGRLDNALYRMRRAVAQLPNDGSYRMGLGYLMEEYQDYEGARAAYVQAIQRSPLLIDSGYWQTSDFRRALKASLPNQEALSALTRASAAYLSGDLVAASQLLEEVQQSTPVLVLRSRVDTELSELASAEEQINRAVAASPANADAHLARGQLYLAKGEQELALRELRIAGMLGEKRADLLLGELAYQQGGLEKAIALFQGSIPDCAAPTLGYDYASQVYHRSDITANFWPETIICAPYDHLVPYYLHFATSYSTVGRAGDARELCQWLLDFYEPSYLSALVGRNELDKACPQNVSMEASALAGHSRSR
jgi:O-antigen ligase/Flp pilus assembly protein TadD